jgi:cobalt-zinc-cadmium efflux system membrane fusion protein
MNMNKKIMSAATLTLAMVLHGCGADERGSDPHGHEAEVEHGRTEAGQDGADEHGHDEPGDPHGDGPAGEHGGPHGDEHGDEHGAVESDPNFARVSPERAPALGIVVEQATGGAVAETVTLTGRLIIDPRRTAAVRARFPGPVVRVHKEVGENVRRGEPLAEVESNESLTVYTVRSPLEGVVLERMTNVGDVAGTDAIYRVGDVTDLQAELKAFPSQRTSLAVGARARVQVGDSEAAGTVVAIAPQVEGHTQALDVRVALERPQGRTLVPGEFVTGVIERGRAEAAVAVPFDAVQRLDGREVVFVPEPEGFRAQPVGVGRRGAASVEIRSGLRAGERYVAKGAFLLKAEIGKNEAAHEH